MRLLKSTNQPIKIRNRLCFLGWIRENQTFNFHLKFEEVGYSSASFPIAVSSYQLPALRFEKISDRNDHRDRLELYLYISWFFFDFMRTVGMHLRKGFCMCPQCKVSLEAFLLRLWKRVISISWANETVCCVYPVVLLRCCNRLSMRSCNVFTAESDMFGTIATKRNVQDCGRDELMSHWIVSFIVGV